MMHTWVEGPTFAAEVVEPPAGVRMVAALLRERADLVRRDLPDRVAQVDEQLRRHGHDPTGPAGGEQDKDVT